jgi:hypothetical protein
MELFPPLQAFPFGGWLLLAIFLVVELVLVSPSTKNEGTDCPIMTILTGIEDICSATVTAAVTIQNGFHNPSFSVSRPKASFSGMTFLLLEEYQILVVVSWTQTDD